MHTVRVEVGGYQLAADVTAGDLPAVVFLSGRGDGRIVWEPVLAHLRCGAATICYDRGGIGDSDPQPVRTPRPYSALVDELLALLRGLAVAGPFVVVGHSLGAVIARTLAARHPGLVAGLVLADGSVDEVALWPGVTPHDGTGPAATLLDYPAGAAELADARYPTVPAAVIARTPGRAWSGPVDSNLVDRRWTLHQHATADRLDAVLLVANDSGHYVIRDAAGLVALAVDAIVGAIRATDGRVQLDHAQVVAAGGGMVREQSRVTRRAAGEASSDDRPVAAS